ncbi:hypothetical protein A2U01_0114026, partial [Trifolium medium]|nr:hypothetical protein [Trifolium medium]
MQVRALRFGAGIWSLFDCGQDGVLDIECDWVGRLKPLIGQLSVVSLAIVSKCPP